MAEDSALFQEAMKRGSTHAWSGRWKQAIEEYQLALVQFPEDVSARTYMAMALYKTGRLQEALELYQDLWQAQPSNLAMLQRLAEIQETLGDRESAVASYRVLAEIHSHRRAPREAVKAWRKVVELKPDFPMFWDSLAEAALETGTVREVMPGYLNLAREMALAGRFQEAIQITEKARSLDPGYTAIVSLLESIRRGLQYSWRAASSGEEVSSEELARLIPPVLIKVDVHVNAPSGISPQTSQPREDAPPASQSASLEALGNLLAASAEQRVSVSPPESVEDIRERVADVQKQVLAVREQVAEVHEKMAAVQGQVTATRDQTSTTRQGEEEVEEAEAVEPREEAQASADSEAVPEQQEESAGEVPEEAEVPLEAVPEEPEAAAETVLDESGPVSGSANEADAGESPEEAVVPYKDDPLEYVESSPHLEESPIDATPPLPEGETPEELGPSATDGAQEEAEVISLEEEHPKEVEALLVAEEPEDEPASSLADSDLIEDLEAPSVDNEAAGEAAPSLPEAEFVQEMSASPGEQQFVEEMVPLSAEEPPVEEETPPAEDGVLSVEEDASLAEERSLEEEILSVEEEMPLAEEPLALEDALPVEEETLLTEDDASLDAVEDHPDDEESLEFIETLPADEESPEELAPPLLEGEQTATLQIPATDDGLSGEPAPSALEVDFAEEEILLAEEETLLAEEQPVAEEILPAEEEVPSVEEPPIESAQPLCIEDDRLLESAGETDASLVEKPEAEEPGLSWSTSEDVVESEQPSPVAREPLAAADLETRALSEANPDEESLPDGTPLPEMHDVGEPEARALEDAEESQPFAESPVAPASWEEEFASVVEEESEPAALSWEETMVRAQEAKRSGRLQEAIELFEQGMAAGTFIAEHLVELAEAYQQVGQMDRAMSTYDRTLELVPGHPRALIGKARHYLLVGELGQARDEVRRVLETPANDGIEIASPAVDLLLEVLREGAVDGDLEEVAEELAWLQSRYTPGMLTRPVSVALSEAPTELLGHCAGEHLQEVWGLPVGVRGDLIQALRQSEEQLRLGLLRSAADEMWRVIAARPDFLPAQSLLGRVLVAQGRAEEARQKAQLLLELYRQRGRLEQSLEVLWWAAAHGLVDDEGRSELITLLRTQHRNEDASLVGLSWQILSGRDEYAPLAAELFGQGDDGETGLTREAGVASSGSRGEAASEPNLLSVDDLLLLAESRFALGDRDGAAGLLREALVARGSDGDVKVALARILNLIRGDGDGQEALAEVWEGLDLPEELVN